METLEPRVMLTIAPATAAFIAADTTTQGNWNGAYGADGYNVIGDAANYPSYAQVSANGNQSYVWASSTSAAPALQKETNPSDRIAATWYAPSSFTLDVNLTDGNTHQLALYLLDWDHLGRSERIDVVDAATGAVLNSQTASNFSGGEYLRWTLGGHVDLQFTSLASPNAVVSGLFFGQPPATTPASASFVQSDSTTEGNWQNAYGSDGYNVIGSGVSYPSYARLSASGEQSYVWAASTTDGRALEKTTSTTDRIAATWYSPSSFTLDVNLTDGNTHAVSLYLLDWDQLGRSERIDVIDPLSGSVLNSQTVSGFGGGEYLTWKLGGHAQLRITTLSGPNAVVSGLFFGNVQAPASAPASASFVQSDRTTEGNWQNAYGTDGYNVIGDAASYPSYVHVNVSGQQSYVWTSSTSDSRALQKASDPTDRIAATWYSPTSFTIDVTMTDGKIHEVALYLLDWDGLGRSERIDVVDPLTGTVLNSQTVSAFGNGEYVTWTLGGHVQLRITDLSGGNAVVSGLFFGNITPPASNPATASFITADTTTAGTWQGKYGSAGYDVFDNAVNLPTYARLSATGEQNWVWASSTTDARALQKVGSPSDRIAATWYAANTFTVDLNLTDGQVHKVAAYFLDWDNGGRTEQVTLLDPATGATLDTRTVSNFTGGEYLVWNLSGHVELRFTRVGGLNAVLSGLFFDGLPPATGFVKTDTTTEGNWRPSYASDGYDVAGDSEFQPSYAQISISGQQLNVWASSTGDARALASASSPGDRVAADWTANSSFTINVNLTDAKIHQVALYLLDWDNLGRSERIDVLNASTLAVINSQTVSNFSDGEYLVWDLSGNVKFKITSLNSQSAVASGVFFTPPGGALGDYILTPNDRIPNFGEHPTITSVASGNWSNPSTWSLGRLPTTGDIVDIRQGTTVSYDVSSTADLNTLEIQSGGELDFRTDINTEVVVQNFVVLQGGTLTVGTAANPVAANVTAQILIGDQAPNTTTDPEQFGNGLIALGTVTMHGAPLSDSFVQLATEPHAGDTTLSLAQAVTGWKVGDKLVLPDTRQLNWNERGTSYTPEDETITVAAIAADDKTITLTSPLQFDHLGGRNVAGTLVFLPHVGDISRNVFVASQNPSDIANRGQVMFTDRANVDVEDVGFYGLGRTTNSSLDDTAFGATGNVTHVGTNEENRNPVQFRDLNGPTTPQADGYQFTFIGNAVTCLTFDPMPIIWGINLNASSYGLIQDNVLFNWGGAGLAANTGAEIDNRIEHNFAVDITGDGQRGDPNMGDGFWFRGPDNYVDDNVAADMFSSTGPYTYGFSYYAQYVGDNGVVQAPAYQGADPTLPGQSTSLNLNATPLASFVGNEVYGVSSGGMDFWWLGAFGDTPVGNAGTIKDLHVWHTWDYGVYAYESNNLTIDGLVVLEDPSLGIDNLTSYGIWFGDYQQTGMTITNADIEGAATGILLPDMQDGLLTVENSYLCDATDVMDSTMSSTNGTTWLPAKTTDLINVKFDALPGQPLDAINMYYTESGVGNGGSNTNLIQSDTVFVTNYNQVSGDDFQVFYSQQVASFIVPQTGTGPKPLVGSPEAGLTNQQNWNKYGIAIAGAVAPADATTQAGIEGLVAPISST